MKIINDSTYDKTFRKKYRGTQTAQILEKRRNAFDSYIIPIQNLLKDKESLDFLYKKFNLHKLTDKNLNYFGKYEYKTADQKICFIIDINDSEVIYLNVGTHGDLGITSKIFSSYSMEDYFKELNKLND